jgi:hypothetical protein
MGPAILLIVLAQACAVVLSFTLPKDPRVSRWFYVPSLAIAWIGYVAYENLYIPRYCPGECSIRVDLLLIYPYLALLTVSAIAYFARRSVRGEA